MPESWYGQRIMGSRVSVHVVTFNQRDFVEETLRSALTQDHQDLEVVVADDGSTDGTIEIIEALAQEFGARLKPIVRQGHLGIPHNFNRALDACTGDFVALLAGDDLFLPGKISAQVAWFQRNPSAVMCAHDVEHFPWPASTGTPFVVRPPVRSGVGSSYFLRQGAPFNGISIMLRRSAMPPRGYDLRFPYCADWKMWLDCLAKGGEFGTIDGVLSRYRVHARSFSQQNFMRGRHEALMMLAAFEGEHPKLARDVRAGRAQLLLQWGNTLREAGDRDQARQLWRAALAEDPLHARRAARNLVSDSLRPALSSLRALVGRAGRS